MFVKVERLDLSDSQAGFTTYEAGAKRPVIPHQCFINTDHIRSIDALGADDCEIIGYLITFASTQETGLITLESGGKLLSLISRAQKAPHTQVHWIPEPLIADHHNSVQHLEEKEDE